MGRIKGIKNAKPQHNWSEEEKEYIKKIVVGRGYKEIQQMMNDKFEYQFTMGQIKGAISRYKLNTGRTGYFPKGNIPFNKGKKGYMGANRTSFKKGNVPLNKKPVGSERINVEGYVEIKVSEPNKFRLKQRVMYEKYHNTKLTNNDVIIFLDRNKQNFNKNNLEKITRAELARLNQNDLIKNDADITKAGLNIVKILSKIRELEK